MEFDFLEMGQRIAEKRKQLKIKQNTLAERIGVSNNHLSGIERGQTVPSMETFIKICNELETTPDYLLMGSMHTDDLPRNLCDSLTLCSKDDLATVCFLVQHMLLKNQENWNGEHFSRL